MNKTQRLVELLLTMNSRQKYTLRELAERFGVSKRTVLRDLGELEALGVPLYAEYGSSGGYRILKERTLPPITLIEREAVALFFIGQSLQYYRDLPMETDWQSALAKLYHAVPEDIKVRIDELQRRVLFWVPEQQLECPLLPTLLDSAIAQHKLRIVYESESGVTERDIQLVGLYAMNGKWYCPAFDGQSGEYRVFRADRIRSAVPTPDQQDKRNHDKLHIADWFKLEQKQTAEEKTYTLHVRLTRRGVLRCQSEPWLAIGLKLNENGTGTIHRTMSAAYIPWAASYFAGCQTDAIVEGPPELRSMIISRLQETLALYERETQHKGGIDSHEQDHEAEEYLGKD